MRERHFFGIGILTFFIGFSIVTFNSSLTPYVNFAQAKSSNNSSVQIRGVLVLGSIIQAENHKGVKFVLSDEQGAQVAVVYHGGRPEGFEQASSIVAIGKYQDGQFNAERLLLKCPSKYQKAQGSDQRL